MSASVMEWLFGAWWCDSPPTDRREPPDGGGRAPGEASAPYIGSSVRADGTPQASDQETVARITVGDHATFAALFREYYPRLRAFAATVIRSHEGAEEVVDDVFLRIWDTRATWAPQHSIRAYLYGAVRNRALNAIAARQSAHRITRNAAAQDAPVAMSEGPASPDTHVLTSDLDAIVAAAMARLPEDARLTVALRWKEGMRWEEIAHILGITAASARMRHTRALRLLKTYLPPDLVE